MNKKLGIFVPVYNEEKIVARNIKKIIDAARKQKIPINIYAINDGSTDNTTKILSQLSKKISNLKVIHYKNGPSRRENLARAMSDAKEEIIMFMDLDLATDLKYLQIMYKHLKKFSIVTGSRYTSEATVKRELIRLAISKTYNSFMKLAFLSKLKDHQIGFKGFQSKIYRKLYGILKRGSNSARGWFWDAELLILAQRMKIPIKEFAIDWVRGEKSSFNVKQELKMIPYVLLKFPITFFSIKKK